MGWWKHEGSEAVIGDSALDALTDAVRATLEAYEEALHRRPVRAEWEALLVCALGSEEPGCRPLDEKVIKKVIVETDP